MRNLFLLLLLGFSLGYGQDVSNNLLLESDFTISEGRMLVSDFPCQISSAAATDPVKVSVTCKIQAFKEFGIQKINDMILFANEKIRSSFSGQYKPAEFKMSYNPYLKAWSMTSLFTLQDGSGAIKENLLSLDFDSEGKFLLMKKIF